LYSYPLLEKQLRDMLQKVGFASVEKVQINASDFTDSYLVRK